MLGGYLFPDIVSIPKKNTLKSECGKIKLEWTSQKSDTTFCQKIDLRSAQSMLCAVSGVGEKYEVETLKKTFRIPNI